MNPTRRKVTVMLVSAPAVAWALDDEKKDAKPSPEAEFLAANEPGLTDEERARLKKNVTEGETALKAVRDFKVPPEVAPSLRFQPLKSARR
jgi:hypothetical protein